jgi:hypothetical protein
MAPAKFPPTETFLPRDLTLRALQRASSPTPSNISISNRAANSACTSDRRQRR